MIRSLRKTAPLLGLIGSVSLLLADGRWPRSMPIAAGSGAGADRAGAARRSPTSPRRRPAHAATLPEPEPRGTRDDQCGRSRGARRPRSRSRCPTAPPRSLPSRPTGCASPWRIGWRTRRAIRELRLTKADGEALSRPSTRRARSRWSGCATGSGRRPRKRSWPASRRPTRTASSAPTTPFPIPASRRTRPRPNGPTRICASAPPPSAMPATPAAAASSCRASRR